MKKIERKKYMYMLLLFTKINVYIGKKPVQGWRNFVQVGVNKGNPVRLSFCAYSMCSALCENQLI